MIELLDLRWTSFADFYLLVINGKIEFTMEIAEYLTQDTNNTSFYDHWSSQLPAIQNSIDLGMRKGFCGRHRLWHWRVIPVDSAPTNLDHRLSGMIERAKMLDLSDE